MTKNELVERIDKKIKDLANWKWDFPGIDQRDCVNKARQSVAEIQSSLLDLYCVIKHEERLSAQGKATK